MSASAEDYLPFFLDEAADILGNWEKACLALEQDQSVASREELYRAAHNLKSGSFAVGASEFSGFVRRVEDVISRLLGGQLAVSPALIKCFLNAQTVMVAWLAALRAPGAAAPADAARVLAELT